MKFNERRFNHIIKESIDNYINEIEQVAVGGSDTWSGYNDGYEGKMRRMQPTGINRAYDDVLAKRANMPKKDYTVNPPSVNDWRNNFSHMTYQQYVEKRKNGEL